jgi:zinc/manganese transport system substrate-binding protein
MAFSRRYSRLPAAPATVPLAAALLATAFTAVAWLAFGIPPARAAQPIRVTTTLGVLRSLVEEIGGDRVRVESIAPPASDPHFMEPRPSDMVRLGRSDFFVHMGLDLELWRGPLVEAAVNPRLFPGGAGEIDASTGVPLLEVPTRALSRAEGDIHLFGNPHYWLDPTNAAIVARHISERLSEYSPADAEYFMRRFEALKADLERRSGGWRAALERSKGSRLAAYHNSWPYLGHAFGLRIDLFLEPKPGIPPSGAHLESLVAAMKRDHVRAVIVEPFQPRRSAQAVAERAGARVLELWQNPDEKMTYADMMERNVRALGDLLAGSSGAGR